MNTITFRPLRRVKKSGKIVVASYMQWRKLKTADYSKFNLIVDNEYSTMPKNEFVYDHEGNLLFFKAVNPADISVVNVVESGMTYGEIVCLNEKNVTGICQYRLGNHSHYIGTGIDCDGVPTFSHFTMDYLGTNYSDMESYTPLTVGIVRKWFGWFLYQLENSNLQIGK